MRKKSRTSDAIWTAFTETIRFIVVPYVLVDLVTKNFPDLDTAFMPQIKLYIIFFGGMIASASTLEVMNRPGTFKRMLFGLSSLAFICLWLFVVFGGGVANFRWGPYFVEFDMSKIVYIMLFGVSLKALLVVDTYSLNRELVKDEEKLEKLRTAKLKAAARKQIAPRRRTVEPAFSSMAKVQYRVTPDDEVGASQYAPQSEEESLVDALGVQPTEGCPVCGEPTRPTDKVCRNCGAWISRPSHGRSR
ncbi:MAG: zinc ribbon domain-containing protein [Candidatus Thermoplasmatota archaeon]|nr:zinc ribbon domain-containing protein [Candidatus Thermoplasmatota archaeon]